MGRLFARQASEREQRDELLSAYLDGQLSAGERARLEAQLAADPALRAELEALRHTVALVRELPPVPIPRNFILPRAMAARPRPVRPLRPRRAWAAPLLTAATAVVSLLFVVVLAGDLLLSGIGGQAFAPAAEPLLEAEAPQAALAPSPASEQVEVEAVVEVEAEEEIEAEEVEKAVPAATAPAAAMEAPPEAPAEATAEVAADNAETPEGAESPAPARRGDRALYPDCYPARGGGSRCSPHRCSDGHGDAGEGRERRRAHPERGRRGARAGRSRLPSDRGGSTRGSGG